MSCIFCRIIAGELPSDLIYEDEHVVAFEDVNPQASTHVLLMPRLHVTNLFDETFYGEEQQVVREALWQAVPKVMDALGLDESKGFRLIQNNGKAAGQTVQHIHFHLISGDGLAEKLV